MAAASADDELSRARDLGVDTCGRIAEFWGFTRTMGRAFGLLYLSVEPLPQVEIQRQLDISAGSASMTLAALGRWGVVHRVWVRGQRREHYRAETDFWKMISGVLNERERREIAAAITVVEKARAGARRAESAARGGPARLEARFVSERLRRLDDICRLGQTMLDMLLGQLRLDVGGFLEVLRVGPPDGGPATATTTAAATTAAATALADPAPAPRAKLPARVAAATEPPATPRRARSTSTSPSPPSPSRRPRRSGRR